MQQNKLSYSLKKNLQILRDIFGASGDFYTKEMAISGIPCAIVMFTGLSSSEKLCHLALEMLDRDPVMLGGSEGLCEYLLKQSRVPAEANPVEDWDTFIE